MTRPIVTTWPAAVDPYQELRYAHDGLDFHYGPARVRDGGQIGETSAGSVELADNDTNYIEADPATGDVSANTDSFSDDKLPLYVVSTSGGSIDSVEDRRAFFFGGFRDLSSDEPEALADDADAGEASTAARSDHRHPMPSAGDVGADPEGTASDEVGSHVDADDPHPQYLEADDTTGSITTDDGALQLVGDEDDPAPDRYYGTDDEGELGFHAFPDGGGGGASTLDGLDDVEADAPADGEALVWNAGEQRWEPGAVAAGDDEDGAYAETIGNDDDTTYTVAHDLGTRDVVVALWDVTDDDSKLATSDADSVEATSADAVSVTFDDPPGEDAYRVVIVASGHQTYQPQRLKVERSNKDGDGIFRDVTYRRYDGTAWMESRLRPEDSGPEYDTREVDWFGDDGTTVRDSVTYDLTYDGDGDLIEETAL